MATDVQSITDADLLAMWGSEPTMRLIPVFADSIADIEVAKTAVRSILGVDPGYRVYRRDEGVNLLRRLARDPGCTDFDWSADLLAKRPATDFLVLGWAIK